MKVYVRIVVRIVLAFLISSSALAIDSGDDFIPQTPFLTSDKSGTLFQILNNGTAAFAKRLEMIENAKKTIEVEYFIYSIDKAGKVFTQALIKKAKEGVKVRILVDAASVIFELDEYFAKELKQYGIEVRYYNTAWALSSKAILYRNHRKMLVVDDTFAIVGGRNIANEYFDISDEYNFLDRDVYTEGKIALIMRQSFDAFWDAKIVDEPKMWKTKEPPVSHGPRDGSNSEARHNLWEKKTKLAKEFIAMTEENDRLTEKIKEVGQRLLKSQPTGYCGELVFATDRPGTDNNRVLWDHLVSIINKTKTSLITDSPYFILKNKGHTYLSEMLNRGVDLSILTNSLNSTDAFYTIPVFKNSIKQHIKEGAKVYVYKGEPMLEDEFAVAEAKNARWGIHAKTAVFDHDTIMIGTFNVDPRSKNLNTELALFCYDSKYLASALEQDIQKRIGHAVQLNDEGLPVDGRGNFYGAKFPKRLMYHLFAPLAHIFDGLL